MICSSPQAISRVFGRITPFAIAILCCIAAACSSSPLEKEAKFIKRGQALLEKKDYSRALLEFQNAARAMPKDAEPFYQMGMTFLASGNMTNGVAALRKALELNPHHEQAELKLAELMITSSNKQTVQQAAEQLKSVLSTLPDNSEASNEGSDALALAEWKLGQTDEAISRLEETLQKLPARLQTSIELARLMLEKKDVAGAEQVLKQAVASARQSSPAELALGELYMIANQPAKAEVELRQAIQLDPKNGQALLGLAAIQAAANRTDEAEQTYLRVSSLPSPEFKPLHALFLYKVGKRDAALAELQKLAKQDPDDRAARGRLLAAYLQMGKSQSAQDLLAAALKKNPKDADALYERAGISMRAGKIVDAERDLKEVLRFKPDFAQGHVAMAAVYRAENLKSSERQELTEALRIAPTLLQARITLARSFTLSNEAKSALDLMNRAPANQKGTLPALVERNWALFGSGDTKEMRSILDQALRIRRVPELVLQDAVLRLQERDFPGAASDAEELVKQAPEDVRVVRLLVDAYLGEKQNAKAEERLKQIVAAHPQSAPLQNLLGQWYLKAKNYAAARKALETATAIDFKFQPAVLALADLDHKEKHLDAARQRLLAMLSADPENVPAVLMLGDFAGEMGDSEEAVRRYRAALAVDASNAVALNNLAYTLIATDADAALKYAQQAVELAPDNAAIGDTLGWIYYRKALYGPAVTTLEKAVAKEPTPQRQFHLAMAYLKSGKRDLGEKTLQSALRQDPSLAQSEKVQ